MLNHSPAFVKIKIIALDLLFRQFYGISTMPYSNALSFFRTDPYRYNCAQSICAAFGRDDLLESLGSCGSGKAPDGVCGALFGALQIIPGHRHKAVMEAFVQATGAIHCLQLKKECKVPCQQCVTIAQELVARELGGDIQSPASEAH